MKRAVFLAALGLAGVLAPGAAAYVTPVAGAPLTVQGDADFGPTAASLNAITINATAGDPRFAGGTIVITAPVHPILRWTLAVRCLHGSLDGTQATVLAQTVANSTFGEPANLYGALLHFHDGDSLSTEGSGVNDQLDITNFNQAQYLRQQASDSVGGCGVLTVAKRAIRTEGSNITIVQRVPAV
jgi:hypothetical protein